MPKYKKMFEKANMTQAQLLQAVQETDARVDKPLLSKMVNYVCLPTEPQFKTILNALDCNLA